MPLVLRAESVPQPDPQPKNQQQCDELLGEWFEGAMARQIPRYAYASTPLH